ncbi:hypothetical protein [Scatolibacter rhodanostii]|uniref:hypothetical protein n=1 Tax=Scatolibacter rhodanostii TaxID=2014781 RepID=UPI000C079202|nr:hypothetical protein [Scatolibacter rhodanostii]
MKKIAVLITSLILVFTLTGCMPTNRNSANATASVDLVLPTKAGEASGQEEIDLPKISDTDFKDDMAGLCEYLEKTYSVADEKAQMSYDVIEAKDGYRYLFRYNKSTVQIEVYEFDLENLTEEAKTNLENVKANGKLKVIEKEVDAVLSNSGKYVMIYQDQSKEEANAVQKERVIDLFKTFHQA